MKKRLSEREGGQFLILPPEAVADSGEDGALSIRTPGSSLQPKGMKSLECDHSLTLENPTLCPLPASELSQGSSVECNLSQVVFVLVMSMGEGVLGDAYGGA